MSILSRISSSLRTGKEVIRTGLSAPRLGFEVSVMISSLLKGQVRVLGGSLTLKKGSIPSALTRVFYEVRALDHVFPC